jgi:hypothetical protein
VPRTQQALIDEIEEWLALQRRAQRRLDSLSEPDLDAEVARVVFRETADENLRHPTGDADSARRCLSPVDPAPYSTDADSARWVVDRLIALGWSVVVECRRTWRGRQRWRVAVGDVVEEDVAAAPAICRAALRALRSAPLDLSV